MFDWFNEPQKNGKPKNIWLKDFAIKMMIGNQRLSEFEKRNDYFAWIMSLCKGLQESYLFNTGLDKSVYSQMTLFALKNVAGWRDQFETSSPLNDSEVDALKKLALNQMRNAL